MRLKFSPNHNLLSQPPKHDNDNDDTTGTLGLAWWCHHHCHDNDDPAAMALANYNNDNSPACDTMTWMALVTPPPWWAPWHDNDHSATMLQQHLHPVTFLSTHPFTPPLPTHPSVKKKTKLVPHLTYSLTCLPSLFAAVPSQLALSAPSGPPTPCAISSIHALSLMLSSCTHSHTVWPTRPSAPVFMLFPHLIMPPEAMMWGNECNDNADDTQCDTYNGDDGDMMCTATTTTMVMVDRI